MPPFEWKDSSASESSVDSARVSHALRTMIFNDSTCSEAAAAFNEYLQTNPDPKIDAVRYDGNRGVFVFSHKIDGEFPMFPEKFFALRKIRLILHRIQERLKSVLEGPKAA